MFYAFLFALIAAMLAPMGWDIYCEHRNRRPRRFRSERGSVRIPLLCETTRTAWFRIEQSADEMWTMSGDGSTVALGAGSVFRAERAAVDHLDAAGWEIIPGGYLLEPARGIVLRAIRPL